MGFHTGILILSPFTPADAKDGVVCWRPSELINIGYSYRDLTELTSAQSSHVSDRLDSQGRAGVATFNHLLSGLREVRSTKAKDLFAPRFVPSSAPVGAHDPGISWVFEQEGFWSQLEPGDEYIIPFQLARGQYPNLHEQRSHNAAWESLKPEEWETRPYDYVPIHEYPMIWVTCRKLSGWIEAFLSTTSPGRTQLFRDREAKARVQGWLGQLKAYSKIHARALFMFEPVTWP